jgi:hypothetical protein
MALVTKESLKISMIFNYWFAEMLGVGKSLYITETAKPIV